MQPSMRLGLAAVGLVLCGCTADWEPVGSEGLSDPKVLAAFERADTARSELAGRLQAELLDALASGGPPGAISVCRERATAIAADVSESMGLRIGRTSYRLRNPDNVAPPWAAAAVAEETRAFGAWHHGDGRIGVLYPIPAGGPCLTCHGSADDWSDELRTAIRSNYPDDRATGFAAGDVRGYFWIELPAG